MITEKPCRVFCCYARKDHAYLTDLKTHLKPLERDGLITVKADIDISPGMEWETIITHHLEGADIILLLISPDFVASDYCFNQEMRQAIARHEQGTACVIPVIIRPTDWHTMPFSKLQALPKDATPISTSPNIDTAFLSVVKGIRTVVQELIAGITVDSRSGSPSWSPIQEDLFSTSSQKRSDRDTQDDSGRYIINNHGSVHGQVIGGQHGQVFSGNTINITTPQKNGLDSLKKGANALRNKEYGRAKDELKQAVEYLDENNQPAEASQAHYLLILALLGDKLPRSQGNAGMTSIKELMSAAIRLYPCPSYYLIFARIYRNFFEATRSRNDLREAENFERKGTALPPRAIDTENMQYFQQCQPRLATL